MKSGAAEGHRRRCASLGRRHDNRINTSESQAINRSCPRLPRIGQTGRQSDYVLHYPGQLMSVCDCFNYWLAVWCSGNALVSINAVALHRARLVLGRVTAFGQVNCLIT